MSQTEPPPPSEPMPPQDVAPTATPPDERAPDSASPARSDGPDPLRSSRTSGAFAGVIATAVLLVLLVVFIFQNTQSVEVAFLGFDRMVPLAAALLIATAAGMAIVALVGSLRILQLRRRVRRDTKERRKASS